MPGNTSASSLIKTATAAQKRKLEYEDDIAVYRWNMSAKTADDYSALTSHLNTRAEKASDPSKQLTYIRQIDTARRTFTSSELERQSMSINEGSGTLQDKQNRIIELYNSAADNGDADLMQTLRGQFDTIDKQIQSEAEASFAKGQAAASKMSQYNVTSAKQLAKQLEKGEDPTGQNWSLKMLSDAYKQNGPDWANKQSFDGPNGQKLNFWDLASYLTEEIANAYDMASEYSDDPGSQFDNQEKAQLIRNGETKFKFMGGSLSLNDIYDARDAASAGQQLFSVKQNANGEFELAKNKTNGYMWGKTQDGTYRMIKTYGNYGDSKKDTIEKYRSKLEKAGFDITKVDEESGQVEVRSNSKAKANAPGLKSGNAFVVTFDAEGDARFVSVNNDGSTMAPKIYQVNLGDRTTTFGKIREVRGFEDTGARAQIESLLDAGASYSKIAKTTGLDPTDVRWYADTTRPGYGVPSQKMQNTFGVAKGPAGITSPLSTMGGGKVVDTRDLLAPFGGTTAIGPAQTPLQRNMAAVNKGLDKGLSYELLAKQTGVGLNEIRAYADKTRPGYGVSKSAPIAAPKLQASAPVAARPNIAAPLGNLAPRAQAAPTPKAAAKPAAKAAPKQKQWWNPFSWF